ncbi:MAG: DegV family protein, partial [Nanoarchaeota archaeon]
FNSATQAAATHQRSADILVADSHTAGPAQALIAAGVKRYFENVADVKLNDVAEAVERLSRHGKVYVVADDLKFLASGGRVGAAKLLVGSILKMKPLISIRKVPGTEGTYAADVIAKPRTMRTAVSEVANYVSENSNAFAAEGCGTVDIAIVHADNAAMASSLEEQVIAAAKRHGLSVNLSYSGFMTPILGRHFGPGSVGVATLYKTG